MDKPNGDRSLIPLKTFRNLSAVCIFAFVALVLGACSNARNEIITSSTEDRVLSDVGKSNISDSDKKLLVDASARAALGSYSLEGKTVASVIDEQHKFEDQQEAEEKAAHEAQLRAQADHVKLVDGMSQAMTLIPVSKSFQKADVENGSYQDKVSVKFNIKNTGKKTVRGFKGSVEFTNSFGDKVIALNLEEEDVGSRFIPGITGDFTESWDYNQFEEEWVKFNNYDLTQLKSHWIPVQIIFADGSSLKADDQSSE